LPNFNQDNSPAYQWLPPGSFCIHPNQLFVFVKVRIGKTK